MLMYGRGVSCSVVFDSLRPHGLYVARQSTVSVHGILQARILEWVAMPSSRGSSQPRYGTQVSHIAGRFFMSETLGKPKVKVVKVAQLCLTLCDRMGSFSGQNTGVGSLSLFRESSQPRDRTQVSHIASGFFTS